MDRLALDRRNTTERMLWSAKPSARQFLPTYIDDLAMLTGATLEIRTDQPRFGTWKHNADLAVQIVETP